MLHSNWYPEWIPGVRGVPGVRVDSTPGMCVYVCVCVSVCYCVLVCVRGVPGVRVDSTTGIYRNI
jgi:hypothetical protein